MRILGIFVVIFGLSFLIHAEEVPELDSKTEIKETVIDSSFRGYRHSQKGIVKIEDEVNGIKVVCYGIANPGSSGGSAISCIKLD